MSKGPSGTTTVEQQQNNPTADAQRPYLTAGWDTASNLASSNPYQYYPGQTLADYNPALGAGYQGEINAALDLPGITNAAYGLFGDIANGAYGVNGSPAYSQLGSLTNGAAPIQNTLLQNAGYLGNVGEAAAGAGTNYGNELAGLGQNAAATGAGAGNYIGSLAPDALSTMLGYSNALSSLGAAAPGAVQPSSSALMGLAGAAGANPSLASLAATANGAYLNSNPYIAGEYAAAAQPVVNAYQTATAPQTDSNFEAAGRYGSGAQANAQSQNEQNLGTTLGNLASNLYGQDYANERNLQVAAGNDLGTQYLGGVNAATNAATNSGTLALGGINAADTAYSNAGNLANQGYSLAGNLAATGANTTLAGINSGIAGTGAAANAQNAAYNTQLNALTEGGNFENADLSSMLNAGSTLQSGYQTGNAQQLMGLSMEPNILNSAIAPYQDQIAGAQGLTSMSQAQINDEMARFYGEQQAPWQTNSQYLTQIGQPILGTSSGSTTEPYFTNPVAGALGVGLGGLGLYNGLSSLGLFGGGSSIPGLTSILGSALAAF
jgi:hypothetical protein